ncbi:MAG: hypothetical protein Ct9H300mP12_02520 [Acidimicrobiales bacterium]|nr:MAG: hypothetical protein Ct9H300mP12_02520 [Acidimicrobiales bacterium]
MSAHRAIVDVDPDLGLVKVVELTTAQDVGRVFTRCRLSASWRGARPRDWA